MKKIVVVWCFLSCFWGYSQPITNLQHFDKNKLQWGYYFGTNVFDFKLDYKNFDYTQQHFHYYRKIELKKSYGFNVGLTGDIRLIEHLNIRFEPGLVYNKRILEYSNLSNDYILNRYYPILEQQQNREINSTYIYMPILLRYSTKRWYNVKPYVTLGSSFTINLSANHKSTADNSEQRFRMRQHTFFYEIGFGIDFYTPYFRFSPSVRGLFSMNNELIHDKNPNSPWTGNLNGIYTRAILINLNFE